MNWSDFDGVLFDLDGVVTPTAEIHERAWGRLFANGHDYTDADYLKLIDGKARLDGVTSFLADRNIELPLGGPDDAPETESVWGYASRKNEIFNQILDEEGIAPYPGTMQILDLLDEGGIKYGLVSSSRNAHAVLEAAELTGRFPVIIDGNVVAERGLPGKPAPDGYLLGAEILGFDPERSVVIEDAVSGVQAGVAGGFGLVIGVDRGVGREALFEAGAMTVVADLDELAGTAALGMRRTPPPEGMEQHRWPVDPWRLVETAYDPADLGLTETLFGLANGHIGMRATPEEGRDAHSHGTFVNGFHETWDIEHAENAYGFARTGQTIINAPDTKLIKLYIDGDPLLLSGADLTNYERSLDMRTGVLTRKLEWVTQAGKTVYVISTRMVSFTHHHLAAMTFEVVVPDDSASIVISSQIINRQDGVDEYHVPEAALGEGLEDPRKLSTLDHRVLEPQVQRHEGNEVVLGYRAARSGMTLACGSRHYVTSDSEATVTTEVDEDQSITLIEVDAEPGESVSVAKVAAYHSSTGVPAEELADRCSRMLEHAEALGVDGLYAEQADYLDTFWNETDVIIGGDDRHQQAIRWNIFQLAQASATSNEKGIPAKGVSGGGYDGHYFWDTEACVMPFLAYTNPMAAKKVLRFRWKTLDLARERAVEMDQLGALFPWRTINGEEASAYYAAGTAQYHINAAVAFAIERYLTATKDVDYLAAEGAEILVEMARLFADLGFYGTDGEFHIHGVTGPDEYTTVVNDNTYTNVMAACSLEYAANAIEWLGAERPDELDALKLRLELDDDELAEWRAAAKAMHIPVDDELNINPQHSNFLELEPWPWTTTPDEKYPLLLHFHPLVIYRHQVLKQADTVLATLLRPDRFTPEQRANNFFFYDPITTGDSSLSAGVQTAAAIRAGDEELGWNYFQHALFLDLCDSHENTSDGVHIASAANIWNCIMLGFLGFADNGEAVSFDPMVPEAIGPLTVNFQVRDVLVKVEAEGTSGTVSTTGGELQVTTKSGVATARPGEPVKI